jgi:hypothetical protein
MLSESKYGTPTMPLPFKKMSEPPLMNFNVVTAPYTGVAGVKPLVETGLDLSWDVDPWYSSLTDPMTHPVISRPMYNTPLVPQRQAIAPPNGAARFQQPPLPPPPPLLPSSSASSRSESGDDWDMSFNSTLNDTIQATSPLRSGNTPELQETAAVQQQQQEAAAMQQQVQEAAAIQKIAGTTTRYGRQVKPPNHYNPTVHHIETMAMPDLLDVLAAKITAKLDTERKSRKDSPSRESLDQEANPRIDQSPRTRLK